MTSNTTIDEEIGFGLLDINPGEMVAIDGDEMPMEARERAVFEDIAAAAAKDTRRALYGIMRELQRRNDTLANAAAYFKIVQDEFDRVVERQRGPIAFLEEQAQRLAKELAGDSKHHDITGIARIQFRHTEPRPFISDPEQVVEWLKQHEREDLIRVKEEPKATLVNALVAESGELIPGVEMAPAADSASIKWGGA